MVGPVRRAETFVATNACVNTTRNTRSVVDPSSTGGLRMSWSIGVRRSRSIGVRRRGE